MLYDHRRPDVAVFIDFENVYVSVRDKLDANPNFETIMDRCNDLGRVVIARAYADWYRYPRITSALYANSIEPMYVPTYYYDKDMGRTGRAIKNSVDMNLCIDVMKTLFTNPNIGKFVLVTGDRDFIPLVNSIRQQGKEVIVIGIGGAASTHLAQSADEFIFYEQLVGKDTAAKSKVPAAVIETAAAHSTPSRDGPAHESDIYKVLVEAIHLVRERGYVSTLGSLKLVMKELMGGDFKESRYKDLNGRPFTKFKDFVIDAERRGKVQIYTSGTVNEVFLPGEDPSKLSQFAEDIKATPVEAEFDAPVALNGYQEQPDAELEAAGGPEAGSSSRSSRRRRRAKKGAARRAAETVRAEVNGQPVSDLDTQTPALDNFYLPEGTEVEAPLPATGAPEPGTDDEGHHADALAGLLAESEPSGPDEELFDRILANVVQQDAHLKDRSFEEILEGEGTAAHEAALPTSEATETAEPALATEQPEMSEGEADAAAAFPAAPALPNVPTTEDVALPPSEEALPAAEQEVLVIQAVAEELTEQPLPAEPIFLNTGEARELAPTPEPAAAPTAEQAAMVLPRLAEDPAPPPAALAEEQPGDQQATSVVEDAGSEPAPVAPAPEPVPPEASPAEGTTPFADDAEEDASIEQTVFSDEEWQAFHSMMATFPKPVSFQQIFDNLRELRKQQVLTRTNEQLRTLVKQAIQNGTLERSGRGSRIYYKLKTHDNG